MQNLVAPLRYGEDAIDVTPAFIAQVEQALDAIRRAFELDPRDQSLLDDLERGRILGPGLLVTTHMRQYVREVAADGAIGCDGPRWRATGYGRSGRRPAASTVAGSRPT